MNRRLKAIGDVTQLTLDAADRTAHVRIDLRGGPGSVDLYVRRYAIDEAEGQHWLTVLDAGASRAWLAGMPREFAIVREIGHRLVERERVESRVIPR